MFDKGDGNILLRPEFYSARLARRGRQAQVKNQASVGLKRGQTFSRKCRLYLRND